jgi:very-short-patch-repair endonuclease
MAKEKPTYRIHPRALSLARSLRQPQTPAEAKLWARLRDGRLCGFKFRRQHPIGPYIADFCCASCKLIVELDGDTHIGKEERDEIRSDFLRKNGYEVVRFFNTDVFGNPDGVLESILSACERRLPAGAGTSSQDG